MFFDKKMNFFDLEVKDRNDALESMAEKLYASGLVDESFHKGILDREDHFPTGLPILPYGIAIPHTDADKVITPQIAFASLKKPVKFRLMGSQNEEVDVSLIFMLALKKAEDQLTMLQRLIELFQNSSILLKFVECKNQKEFDNLLISVGLE